MDVVSLSSEERVEVTDGVHLAQLAAGEEMSIQHYHIEPGASVPLHDHPHEQTGYVVRGTLVFVLEDGTEHPVSAGDSYAIPGGEVHAVENRGERPADGVDIFSPPRVDVPWK